MNSIASTRRTLLAARLKALRGSENTATDDLIRRRAPDAVVEASESQQQICVHSMLATDVCLYNEPVTVHYVGELDVAALESAFNQILLRHEAWRTSFHWSDGRIIQKVAPQFQIRFEAQDLRHIRRSERDAHAIKLASADAMQPFDLSRLPLFRLRLVQFEDNEHRLFLTLHHLIFDGVSLYQIFLPELQHFYKCYHDGSRTDLCPLPFQYPDYCAWQQRELAEERSTKTLQYWQQKLTGDLPILNLPLDRPRPQVRGYRGAMEVFLVPNQVVEPLTTLAQLHNATSFIVLLSAFHVLLYALTGQCDQTVGSATSTRNQEYTDRLIGLFLNTIAIRVVFSPQERFTELLVKTRDEVVAVLGNEVPFSRLIQLFHKSRVPGLSPFFQVMLSLEPTLSPLEKGWKFTQMDVEMGISKFDLHLELDKRAEGLLSRFIYSTELFNQTTIVELTKQWMALLQRISVDPGQTVKSLADGVARKPPTAIAPSQISSGNRAEQRKRWFRRGIFSKFADWTLSEIDILEAI